MSHGSTKCTYCQELGNWSEKCFQTFPDLAPPGWHSQYSSRKQKPSTSAHLTDAENDDGSSAPCESDLFVSQKTALKDDRLPRDDSNWILDSGCTSQMTLDRSSFCDYQTSTSTVGMGTQAKDDVVGTGHVLINALVNESTVRIKLLDVLHVPDFSCHLIYIPKITNRGLHVSFELNKCSLKTEN